MLGDVNKLLKTTNSNVLPLPLKQTFPPLIWIFTKGEGDGIVSRLPFKIFSTLNYLDNVYAVSEFISTHYSHSSTMVFPIPNCAGISGIVLPKISNQFTYEKRIADIRKQLVFFCRDLHKKIGTLSENQYASLFLL